MAKQTKSRRAAAAASTRVEPRDLWLAGLGAVSLTRKGGLRLYGTLLEEGRQFQGRAGERMDALQQRARHGYAQARARVESTYGQVKSEVGSRLQPVLVKLGMAPAPKTRARKPVRRPRKPAATRRTRAA